MFSPQIRAEVSRVAIYARYSTDKQDARSIDDQLRRCRARAEEGNLRVAHEYKDEAVSGATTAQP